MKCVTSYGFSQANRIKTKAHFDYVYSHAKRIDNRLARLYVSPTFSGETQLAFVASKKLGKAAKRNRCKRILKEIFRLHQHKLNPKMDYVVIAKFRLLETTFEESTKLILSLLKQNGFLND